MPLLPFDGSDHSFFVFGAKVVHKVFERSVVVLHRRVGDFFNHADGQIASLAFRGGFCIDVRVDNAIFDCTNIKLVRKQTLENGRSAFGEGKFQRRSYRGIFAVVLAFHYVRRIDFLGQIAAVLRTLVTSNHAHSEYDEKYDDKKQTDFLSHNFHLTRVRDERA